MVRRIACTVVDCNNLHRWKKFDRVLEKCALDDVEYGRKEEPIGLTRPKYRVIARTKWEVKMTMKYSIASTAIVSNMPRILCPEALDLVNKYIINENARKSGL